MKISVAMITYNHEPFVAQAIESVLGQQLDASIELVIGEDASPDRTGEIARRYADAHPDTIRMLPNGENLGTMPNYVRTLEACTGDYVAILDGDDYWSAPHKLQRQLELLESEPSLQQCFHTCLEVYDDGSREPWEWPRKKRRPRYTLADLVRTPLGASSTVMLRRRVVDELPDWFPDVIGGDWALQVLSAQHGDIGYIEEVMSVHRNHAGGIWAGEQEARQRSIMLQTRALFAPAIDPALLPVLAEADFHDHLRRGLAHERAGDLDRARSDLEWCLARREQRGRHRLARVRAALMRVRVKGWFARPAAHAA